MCVRPQVLNLYVQNETDCTITQSQLSDGTWSIVGSPIPLSQPAEPVSDYAQTLTVTPDNRWVIATYFQNEAGNVVDFVDTTLSPPSVVYTVTVGNGPLWSAIMGTNLLVATTADSTIGVIDLTPLPSSAPVYGETTIPVGNTPTSVVVSNDGTMAYVTNYADSTISIDLGVRLYGTPALVSDPSSYISNPLQGAFSPDDSIYVVASTGTFGMATIDVATATVVSNRVPTTEGGPFALAITPGPITT